MPVDQVSFRDLQRFLQTDKAADQVKRQVQMAGAAACHDDALSDAGDDQGTVRMHAHRGVVPLEGCGVSPVDGGIQAVEQTGRGQQTGARADTGECRAGGVTLAQPGDLDVEAASTTGARQQ